MPKFYFIIENLWRDSYFLVIVSVFVGYNRYINFQTKNLKSSHIVYLLKIYKKG